MDSEELPPLQSAREFGSNRWMIWPLGILAVLLGLLAVPYILSHVYPRCHPGNIHEATNNARYLGLFLCEFDNEHGSFPSPATAAVVAREQGVDPLPTTTSNDLLRQLLAARLTQSEEIFYARHRMIGPRKPDNIIEPISRALEPGECGFSYLTGLSTESPAETPLLLTPMIPGTMTFDREAFDGRAVFLRVDQSVKQHEIDKSGRVILPNGLDLFDPAQPFWDGKVPDLRHPAR